MSLKPTEHVSPKGGRFTIRQGRVNDAQGIIDITDPEDSGISLEQQIHWLQSRIDVDHSVAIVAEVDGQVVGFLDFHGQIERRRLSHNGMLGMTVAKNYRDQKIGQELIRALLKWAKESRQIEKVSLAVLANNLPAIHLYKKMGFAEEGRRRREVKIGDTYFDDILMSQFVK